MHARLLLLLSSIALAADAQPVAKDRPAAAPDAAERAIAGEGILRDIQVLASDAFEGRAVATRGEDSTVAFLSRRFREMGLAPAGDGGTYVQRVPLVGTRSQPAAIVMMGDVASPLRYLDDYVAWSHHADTLVRAGGPVVFVGHGVHAPEIGWDDFKGTDVRGKVILMLIGDPPVVDPRNPSRLDTTVFRGAAMTYYGRWTYKYEEAARRGAAAVLLVHQTGPAGYPWSVVQSNDRERFEVAGAGEHVPVEGWISLEATRRLFARGGLDFAALERAAATREFRPVALAASRLSFTVRNAVRRVESRNVVARLAGSDPAARDETVLYSAHWDAYGVGRPIDGDSIYNGALDDASGVAAMLAIAQAFTGLPRPPGRSVAFVAFTAEEQGLLGARWYARNPVVPLAQTVANVNLDALNPWGRTRSIVSLGYGQTTLEDLLAEEARRDGRRTVPDPEPEKGYFYRADHLELARGGVPALSVLFPGTDYVGRPASYGDSVRAAYLARDYHKPSDEVRPDWDMAGIVDDARTFFRVGRRVADSRDWPEWKPGTEFRLARERSLEAARRGRE